MPTPFGKRAAEPVALNQWAAAVWCNSGMRGGDCVVVLVNLEGGPGVGLAKSELN